MSIQLSTDLKDKIDLIVNASIDAVFLIDIAGQILGVNAEAQRLFGWEKQELIGKEFFHTIVPGDLLELYRVSLASYAQTGEEEELIKRVEITTETNKDERMPLELSFAPITIDGQYYLNVTARDLSNSRSIEFETDYFFNHSLDLVCIANLEGYFVRVNPTFVSILGYSESDLLSRPFLDFVHPEDLDATLFELEKLSNGIPTLHFENRYLCKNGDFRWLSWKSVVDSNSSLIYALARDVTDTKLLNQQLMETNALQSAILNSTMYSIIATDTKGHIKVFSRGAEKLLGYERSEFAEISRAIVIHDVEEIRARAKELSEELGRKIKPGMEVFTAKADLGKADMHEWTYIRKDGKRIPVLLTLTSMRDLQGKVMGYVGFARDITFEKRSRERKLEYMREIETINKDLDDFAYVISHDLKAPLRAIGYLADKISEDNQDRLSDESKGHLHLLNSRVRRMHALIEGVLMYSRVGREKEPREAVDLNDLCRNAIDLLAPGDHVTIRMLRKFPVIWCNPMRMNQVFQNLIGNAIKYNDKPKVLIHLDHRYKDGTHEFSIADNGCGIDPKYHEKIFDLFQTLRARDQEETTGVGLSLVKKIIELRGGTIRVESKVGVGSKFIFTLKEVNPQVHVQQKAELNQLNDRS